jgi:hypothetical protein
MPDPGQALTEIPPCERDRLPAGLRDIPEADLAVVASLPAIYLKPLAEAHALGRLDLPRAVEFIKTSHAVFITPQEISAAAGGGPPAAKGGRIEPGESDSAPEVLELLPLTAQASREDIDTLARLLQLCFQDMPLLTAESMASAGMLREALAVVTATRLALESRYAGTEFVLLSLLFLFGESEKRILERIKKSPALSRFLDERGCAPG